METPVTFSLHSTILFFLLPTRVFSLRNLITSHSSPKPPCSFSLFHQLHLLHSSSQSQQAHDSTLLSDQRNSDAAGKRITGMEDPESECETETTMVEWILNKGCVIGKKMVITGIAITSAPLVLPPLLVCSAMGVAISVPFGFVCASYVCTNSIMNKLLPPPPTPPPPLLLEYYSDEDEEEVDCKFDLDEGGGGDYRQTEVGMLYTNDYEDDDIRKENESLDGYGEEVEALTTDNVDGDVDVDEKGYSTDVEEKEGEDDEIRFENNDLMKGEDDNYRQEMEANLDEKEREDEDDVVQREYETEEEEKEQMEDVNDIKENVTQQEEEERILEIEEKVEALMTNVDGDVEAKEEEEDDDIRLENEDDKKREDEGDEHKQTHEVSTTNSSGVDEKGYEEEDGEFLEGDDDSFQEERNSKEEETKDEMEDKVKGNEVFEETKHESDSNGVFEEGKDVEMTEPVAVKEIESQKLVKNEEPVGEMHRVVIIAEGNEENNFNSREIEELDLVAREVDMESNEKVMKDDIEKTSGNDGSEDAILITKEEHSILEGGGDEAKEKTADDNVDVMELSGLSHEQLDSDNVKDTTKTNRKTPSREDILEEEKIWEKLGAMRAIVGYKAPIQPTSIEELKALYVFTGVEPPASFKGDSDPVEVNVKLKYLMSIVGVK